MRKISLRLLVAILTFVVGTAVSFLNPFQVVPSNGAPLTVTLMGKRSPVYFGILTGERSANAQYVVRVKNVSRETIRGYSLGFTCNCRSWDSDGNSYPDGINYTNPQFAGQVLHPGESQETFVNFNDLPSSQFRVWVDLVHFEGKGDWGPNHGHKEGYVRE